MTIPPSLAYFLNIDRTGDYDSQSGNYRSSRLDLDERLAALEKEIRAAKSEAPLHLVLFAHGGLNTERIGAETNLGVQQKIVGKLGSSAHLFALLWENGLCETLQHVAGQTALTELVEQAKRSYNAPPKVIFENLSSLKRLDPLDSSRRAMNCTPPHPDDNWSGSCARPGKVTPWKPCLYSGR